MSPGDSEDHARSAVLEAVVVSLRRAGAEIATPPRTQILVEGSHDGDTDTIVRVDVTTRWGGAAPVDEVWFGVPGDGGNLATVWRHPDDPVLVGLAQAVLSSAAASLIGVPSHTVTTEMVVLRPGRRAVVRVTALGRRWFIKVVAPESLEELIARHRHGEAAGLAVAPIRHTDPTLGLVVFDEIPGLSPDEGGPWPTAAAVLDLVDAVSAIPLGPTLALPAPDPVRSALEILERWSHGTVAKDRLRYLADRLASAPSPQRWATVHGDLHPGQVISDSRGHLRGLLDLDALGIGEPTADLGRWLAEAWVRHRESGGPSREHMLALRDLAARHGDGDRVEALTAAALVGMASRVWRHRWPERDVVFDDLVTAAESIVRDGLAQTFELRVRTRTCP